MNRGKDEEKIMGPMFPRLHVNDTEKGGPRAPPRNKMALYEQLSTPSQRFSPMVLSNNTAANLVQRLSQVYPRRPSEKQYGQYSELSTPLTQVEQRKKSDEDDYTVPIFIDSVPTEFNEYSNGINREKAAPYDPPYSHPSSKLQKASETSVLENSMKQEGNTKGETSDEIVAGWNQTVNHELSGNPANDIDRLRNDDSGHLELCSESQPSSDTEKGNSSNSVPLDKQNTVIDLSVEAGSHEDVSCQPLHTGNLERGDSVVSVTSVLDTICSPNITPDDVVDIIGQKHFWKARRAIVNQQRIFAVQVFELHRLIKVQRLIASSPDLMLEETAHFSEPVKPSPGKKRPLDCAVKAISNGSKKKGASENPSHRKEFSAENAIEKTSLTSAQNGGTPSLSCQPSTGGPPPPSIMGSERNTGTNCFNQTQTHQWLIPVMSPTEGLIYKPYPGTGFVGQACGGCGPPGPNPVTGSFLPQAYGMPAPPTQYPFPSYPPFGPQGYFCPYGMPIMATSAHSGSPVEQEYPSPMPDRLLAPEAMHMPTVPTQKNRPVQDWRGSCGSEEVEVQASTASSLAERQSGSRSASVEGKNMLPFLPTYPASNASNAGRQPHLPERPARVIKVVPHNSISASESAARIFRSIQKERKQYDSV